MMHTRRTLAMAFAIAFALAGALVRPAGAVVLAEDELEETSTIAGAVLRSFAFLFTGAVLRPPLMLEDQDPSGMGIFDIRGYFAHKTPSLRVVAHLQLTTTLRAHPSASPLALGRGVAPPRWLPLRAYLADEDTVSVLGAADWLYASYTRGPMTITAGRQPITFGRAKLSHPSDVVATFALTEVDTEYKPGADALRVDLSVRERTSVSLIAVTGELEDDADLGASLQGTSVLVRGEQGFDRGEIGALAAFVRGDVVVGLDAVVDMGGYELYGEATATLVTGESLEVASGAMTDVASGDIRVEAALGATFKPTRKLTVSPELWYNGFGAASPDGYLAVALSPRVGIGEQTTLGRYYAGAVASFELHPLFTLAGAGLANLGDQSGLVSLSLLGNLSNNTNVVLGGYIGLGETPEPGGAVPVIVDEFGLFPRFFFAELQAVY